MPSRKDDIRAPRSSQFLGYFVALIIKLWSYTLRYSVNGKPGKHLPRIVSEPVIFVLWHNRIFTMPAIWQRTGGKDRKTVVLTSASKDGTVLATAMKVFGLGSIRGSSSRRAVSALIGMRKALRDGYDVCVTPDGPRGPRYSMQPGVIKIAQSTGAQIIPIHITYSAAWRLDTWDRFVIPKPFSHVDVLFAKPITVPPTLTQAELQLQSSTLQKLLIEKTDNA